MTEAGFNIKQGIHPIVPIMLGDAKLAKQTASELLGEGVYVIGFSYPVVPKGEARIRVQLSAAHSRADVDSAVAAFRRVGKRLGIVSLALRCILTSQVVGDLAASSVVATSSSRALSNAASNPWRSWAL
jgi:hypothetical protein